MLTNSKKSYQRRTVLSDSYRELITDKNDNSPEAVKNQPNFNDNSPDDKLLVFENTIDF